MPGARRPSGVGDRRVGGSGQPEVAAAARGEHRDRRRDGEQVLEGQLSQRARRVAAVRGVDVQVDADEAVRGPTAGDAVAGGPGRGGEQGADGRRVGGGVVHPVSRQPALSPTVRRLAARPGAGSAGRGAWSRTGGRRGARVRRRRGHGRGPGWGSAGRWWPWRHFRTCVRIREGVRSGGGVEVSGKGWVAERFFPGAPTVSGITSGSTR